MRIDAWFLLCRECGPPAARSELSGSSPGSTISVGYHPVQAPLSALGSNAYRPNQTVDEMGNGGRMGDQERNVTKLSPSIVWRGRTKCGKINRPEPVDRRPQAISQRYLRSPLQPALRQ